MPADTPTPDELLESARRLEADAVRTGEEEPYGRELRARAAELRRRALGPKIYPVLTCSSCFRVTGWVGSDGRCDSCLRAARREAAYSDPHGGWVALPDTRVPDGERPEPPPLGARLAALIGRRAGLERAIAISWLEHVDPDVTGPIAPEAGFELEVAGRDEVEPVDGSGIVIRFSSEAHRFEDGGWVRLDSTRIGARDLLVPREFSAGLPMEQLAEAWADWQGAVETFNRATWRRLGPAREAGRLAREAREAALAEQRNVSELLDGGGS